MSELYTLWQAKKAGVAPWEDEIFSNDDFVVYRDKYPVSEAGHFLIVPKKNTDEEIQKGFRYAISIGRERVLDDALPITGFNVGMNIGDSAGQTINYPHIHLILRTDGDMEDPTGGIRNIFPGKGNYRK